MKDLWRSNPPKALLRVFQSAHSTGSVASLARTHCAITGVDRYALERVWPALVIIREQVFDVVSRLHLLAPQRANCSTQVAFSFAPVPFLGGFTVASALAIESVPAIQVRGAAQFCATTC